MTEYEPLLDFDFDDVPDEVLPIDDGTYTLRLLNIPEIQDTRDRKSKKVVFEWAVEDEGPFKGRRISDHVSVKMKTRIKRIFLSADVPPGPDLTTLRDAIAKAKIRKRTYTDDVDGETKETSNIKDYAIPGD